MHAKNRNLIVAMTLLATFAGWAGITKDFVKSRLPASADVQLGRWHASHSKCLSYAKKYGVPYIAVWSNGDACGHCQTFEKACHSSDFKKWMASSGCVFHFAHSGDSFGKTSGATYKFCFKSQRLFPLVRVYWYVNGKKKVDIATDGDTVDSTVSSGSKAAKWFKNKLKNYKYTPVPPTPKYTGGEFGVSDEPQARLEAEVGLTTEVTLPLTRTNVNAQASVSTNTVLATYPDGSVITNTVDWDASETAKELKFDTSSLNANEQITLTMLNAAGEEIGTSHITAVAPVENSPKNPLWIGRKTEDELDWGEWTMDLDVATNKVNAHNASISASPQSVPGRLMVPAKQKAYTLVLVGGALWCPDCSAADHNFFERDEFKNWAKEKKVALVAIDIPNLPNTTTSPSLLSRVTARASDRYITANYTPGYSNEAMRVQSGAGYLSRNMISDEAAAAIAARNSMLVGTNTLAGGWNRPERPNQARPGVPSLLVLRGDGSIAGRFSRYSDVGPTSYEAGVLKRLEEIFAQIDEEAEEANDDYRTTGENIGGRDTLADRTLSFTDARDVYRLDPDQTNSRRMRFSITGAEDALVEAKLVSYRKEGKNLIEKTIDSVSGLLSGGLELSGDILSTNCYLSVGYAVTNTGSATMPVYYPVDRYFAHTNETSTVCTYTLTSDFVVIPTEKADGISVPNEKGWMSMALISNETYRIYGLADGANDEYLFATETPGIYTALVTDDVALKFAGATQTNQLWHPGKVGFATPSAFVSEVAGTYKLRVVRTGGVSGTATVRISFDPSKPYVTELITEPAEDFEQVFTWAEGEDDEKTITLKINDNIYADGDQTLYFKAVCEGDAAEGTTQFKLTLRDNDTKKPGKLEIAATRPACSESMITFARLGSTVELDLARVGGADGDLSATLSTTAGTLDETEFLWAKRSTTGKTATLTLPDSGSSVTVTLTPAKGTGVNAAKRKLTVKMLDGSVPGFEVDSCTIEATRYVPTPEMRIALDANAADDATVKVFSGSLVAGLTWKYDKEAKEVVISGVPYAVGAGTLLLRAYNGTTAGLTVAVKVEVVDPVSGGGGVDGNEPLNASVAKSRTFADLLVTDRADGSLAGVLTLTLPRSGRASAKYRTAESGNVALSCANWSAIGLDGSLTANLSGLCGTNVCSLVVTAKPDGAVTVELDDPSHPDGVDCEIVGNVWSASNPATDFKGLYTVSMPRKTTVAGDLLATGDAYVTLKMNTAATINMGKFTYAGVLPTGKSFSGTAVLTARDWNAGDGYWMYADLPIILSSSADALAGAFTLTPGAYDAKAADVTDEGKCQGRCHYTKVRRSVRAADCGIFWRHTDSAIAGAVAELDAAGTYYVATENFVNCCVSAMNTEKLTFFACEGLNALDEKFFNNDGSDNFELTAGKLMQDAPVAVAGVNVAYKAKTKKAAAKNTIATANKKALTLTFTPATGLVSGSFSLKMETGAKTFKFSGVVMPGWGQGKDGEACGECSASATDRSRPFISGTAWFEDELLGEADKKVKVRRSCPFSVGVVAGK